MGVYNQSKALLYTGVWGCEVLPREIMNKTHFY